MMQQYLLNNRMVGYPVQHGGKSVREKCPKNVLSILLTLTRNLQHCSLKSGAEPIQNLMDYLPCLFPEYPSNQITSKVF